MTRRQAIRFVAHGGIAGFLVRTLGMPRRTLEQQVALATVSVCGGVAMPFVSVPIATFAYDWTPRAEVGAR